MKTRFEHIVIRIWASSSIWTGDKSLDTVQDTLTKYQALGWELVSTNMASFANGYHWLFFKRPIESAGT